MITFDYISFENSRVISKRKIEKSLSLGNLDGVRRLARFVGADSVYPMAVFDHCEDQRFAHYQEMRGNK